LKCSRSANSYEFDFDEIHIVYVVLSRKKNRLFSRDSINPEVKM